MSGEPESRGTAASRPESFDLLDRGLAGLGRLVSEAGEEGHLGGRAGAFTLVRVIGSGGMGTVYLGERDAGFRQLAAVKLTSGGHLTKAARERFEREREILAELNHPNIAVLLDGGETEAGEPYIAMEFVDGVPITEYCRTHELAPAARIRLVQQAASALAYAHQRLVVHRDIKPSNVLVTAGGVVKLLDFGIAKRLGASAGAELTQGQFGPMTPEYAAPEQYKGEAITAATDQYQLAVLLFRLLTGAFPYRADAADRIAWARAVVEEIPLTPAGALARAGAADDALVDSPRKRQRLRRRYRGDLTAILLKCLDKSAHARYGSMDAMSADLDAYLAGRPVRARPYSWRYAARKFVQRHRWPLIAAAALLIGLAVGARQYVESIRSRAAAAATANYVKHILESANRWQSGKELTALEIVQRSLREVDEQLRDYPDAQIDLYATVAGSLARNEPMSLAIEASAKRLALMRERGYAAEKLLAAEQEHLAYLVWGGRYQEARSLAARLIRDDDGLLRATPVMRAYIDDKLAQIAFYTQDEAAFARLAQPERLKERFALDVRPGPRLFQIYFSAVIDVRRHEFAHLDEKLRAMLQIAERELAPDAPYRKAFAGYAASILVLYDASPEADALFERALEWREAFFGRESGYVYQLLQLRLVQLRASGREAEAEALFARIIAKYERYPDENLSALQPAYYEGGLVALQSGASAQARARFERARQLSIELCGADCASRRAADDALRLLDADLAGLESIAARDAGHAEQWRNRARLAQRYVAAGRVVEAREQLARVSAWLDERRAPRDAWLDRIHAAAGVSARANPAPDTTETRAAIERLLAP
jgi:serine/threonine-protein kinase